MKISDLLDNYGVAHLSTGHHHCRPGWLQMDCPICGQGTNKWHLGYKLSGGYFHCWRCGHFSPGYILPLLTGLPARECNGLLRQLELERGAFLPREVHKGRLELPQGIGPLSPPFARYLRGRGFRRPDELARLWGLQAIPRGFPLQWRVFIPITYRGKTVSWTTRAITDNVKRRYISARTEQEAIPHKRLLYGEQYCGHGCIVVEGPLDVWKLGPGAVCTCGIGFSQYQMIRLRKFLTRVICFDAEPEGQAKARKLMDQLVSAPGETINVVLDSKDPGEATSRELKTLRSLIGG